MSCQYICQYQCHVPAVRSACLCPCQLCLSISMFHVHVSAAWRCQCFMSVSVLHIHVHDACSCPCCMSISSTLHFPAVSKLHAHAACACCMPMLHIDAPCTCYMSMMHVHVHAACSYLQRCTSLLCPSCMRMLHAHAAFPLHDHAACTCCMSMLHVSCSSPRCMSHVAYPWCLSMLLTHHECCLFSMSIASFIKYNIFTILQGLQDWRELQWYFPENRF